MKLNLTEEFQSILTNYTDEVKDAVCEVIEELGEETQKKLKNAGSFKGTGKYKKSWSTTVKTQRTFDSVIVHNKKHYRLTHLLEFGHATANGGRTRAFPHIAPINEEMQEEAVKRIKEAVRKIK